jgi:hypothetical protein
MISELWDKLDPGFFVNRWPGLLVVRAREGLIPRAQEAAQNATQPCLFCHDL